MQGWSKGVVFVNGQNIGRYWDAGPQQALFLPGPFLNSGMNQVSLYKWWFIWLLRTGGCFLLLSEELLQISVLIPCKNYLKSWIECSEFECWNSGSLTRNKHKVWKICCSFVFQQVIVFEEAEADFKIQFEDSPDLGMTVDI